MAMLWSYFESLEDIEEYEESPLCDFLALDQGKTIMEKPGRIGQSLKCLSNTVDTRLTASSGFASSRARSRTFAEIDHEIISMAIPLPSAD